MKILVTGGTGLVGNGIQQIKNDYDFDFLFIGSKDCDLLNLADVKLLFEKNKPDYVIHLAAFVGGLFKNIKYPVDMYEKNIIINSNVLKCCHDYNVKKTVCCLSTCIFPDKTTYPINEEMLHNGPPHVSNYAYAYAKRMLDIQCKTYQEQYNDNFICVIPTNIYGIHDNYSLEDGHVIPSLIHKCYLAKQSKKPFIVCGSGKPLRQFIFSTDLGKLIMWSLLEYNEKKSIILSVGENAENSIEQISRIIAREFDYEKNLLFDNSFSDGQFKKTADNSKLMIFLPEFKFTDINEGIKISVKWFCDNYNIAKK